MGPGSKPIFLTSRISEKEFLKILLFFYIDGMRKIFTYTCALSTQAFILQVLDKKAFTMQILSDFSPSLIILSASSGPFSFSLY